MFQMLKSYVMLSDSQGKSYKFDIMILQNLVKHILFYWPSSQSANLQEQNTFYFIDHRAKAQTCKVKFCKFDILIL